MSAPPRPPYVQQTTLQYKTFLKRALVEALRAAFTGHPDPTVTDAKVGIDYTDDDFHLPAVIIKYYERDLNNAGVGHFEWFPYPVADDYDDPGAGDLEPHILIPYQHRLYHGDIELDIFGESSVDRDVITDALVEIFTMIEVSPAGSRFIERFYNGLGDTPYGQWHFATLNTDNLTGYGEQAMPPPWRPEDDLVYQTSYRLPIFGEFYSQTPAEPVGHGLITEVDVYPWVPDFDPPPPVAEDKYYKFKGSPPDAGHNDI